MSSFPIGNQEFYALLQANGPEQLLSQYPFYPLDSPAMPFPGPHFIQHAQQLGDTELAVSGTGSNRTLAGGAKFLTYLYLRALYDNCFALPITSRGRTIPAEFVPGHLHDYDSVGPMPSPVMVIGKQPGREEVAARRNLVGPTSQVLWNTLEEIGVGPDVTANWYLTNLVKHVNLNPNSSSLSKESIKNCEILLHQELRLVRPNYILCLGSEASKYMLGTDAGVEMMKGRVVDYLIPLHDKGETPVYHVAKVMTVVHPAAVYRTPELGDDLAAGLNQFCQLIRGEDVGRVEHDIAHHIVYKERELAKLVDAALAEITDTDDLVVAVDAEWHGDRPTEPGSYLRSVQWSHKPKFACCVVLSHVGGVPAFCPEYAGAVRQLRRLLLHPRVRVGGHFFRADLPWLRDKLGIDLTEKYAPPESPEAMLDAGGFDTSLMAHAVNETARFKLEELAVRHTTAPRYDVHLAAWKKSYCAKHKLKSDDLDGYGMCPPEVLYPYSNYDADATRRLYDVFCRLLTRDAHGNDCWRPYWISHSASLAFLEMEDNGLALDVPRTESFISLFTETRERLLGEIRDDIRWPDFNPNSIPQCVALLFGDRYGKRDKVTGEPIRIRPEGAITLDLEPITSTGKRPTIWARIRERGEEADNSPSTGKEALGILAQQHDVARKLRNLRFISQVLKTTLRVPKVQDDGTPEVDEDGNYVYDKGLISHVAGDGRVHTHLSQHLETGRAASRNPNLQNQAKRRESDYQTIIGRDRYSAPLRSVFMATPGRVLMEADLTGAELAGIMWSADDPAGIEHVRRNSLPEDHPDFFDIHSQSAVRAFNLSCPPTKRGLKDAGLAGLRVAAKNINFGIPYGRGAPAMARQCREEGNDIADHDAQRLIDNYFSTYPRVFDYLERCKARVREERWMANAFGRYRRFQASDDFSVIGEMERQAMNFPIQSLVADAVSRALYYMRQYRLEVDPRICQYAIVLQIHDAVLLEVPIWCSQYVYEHVFDECMVRRVPIIPADLNGRPLDIPSPYRFGVDKEVFLHWGEKLTEEQADANGIPLALVH